jgi:ArsR family transcriptional regulator
VKLLEEPPSNETPLYHGETESRHDSLPHLIELFRLLADDTRLKILRILLESEERHVRSMCDSLEQSQPAVSHHLALLRSAGILECRREGKHNFYRLAPGKFEEVLDRVFADRPPAERRVRLGKYVLSCEA